MPGFDRTPLAAPNPPASEAALIPMRSQKKFSRPDVLVGADNSALFPKIMKRCNDAGNNYAIYKSFITGENLITGCVTDPTPACRSHVMKTTKRDLSAADSLFFKQLEAEDISPETAKSDVKLSAKMAEELAKTSLTFDPTRKRWTANYWYDSTLLDKLQHNKHAVEKRMSSVLKKVSKNSDLAKTMQEICDKNFDAKFWIKIESSIVTSELKKHYLPINYVINSNSLSTPVRIVTDSSCCDPGGLSLNQCQLRGINHIGNLRQVLQLARFSPQLATGDLAKFYHCYDLTAADQSLRRLLIPYDWSDPASDFFEAVEAVMPFGDANASIMAVMGRIKNAEAHSQHLDAVMRDKVMRIYQNHAYVDDILAFAEPDEDLEAVVAALTDVAERGGFHFKEWTKTGDKNETKLLGYMWDPAMDVLKLKLQFNTSKSVRGERIEPNFNLNNLDELVSTKITKRHVLTVQGQFFDPLNLFSPAVVKLRLLYSQVCMETGHAAWEQEISQELKIRLQKTLREILPLNGFAVPRFVGVLKPFCKTGTLVIFCDGSLVAFGAAAYWRPGELNQSGSAHLISSTVGICNRKKTTAPRAELLAACKAKDLYLSVFPSLEAMFTVTSTYLITDSTIVLAQLQRPGGAFNIFTGSRIDSIQNSIPGKPWWWTPGPSNPADLLTRSEATLEEMTSSFWLNGSYIDQPLSEWPIKRPRDTVDPLPDVKVHCRLAKTTASPLMAMGTALDLSTDAHPWTTMPKEFNRILERASSLKMGILLVKAWVSLVHRCHPILRTKFPRDETNFYQLTFRLLVQWDPINAGAAPVIPQYVVEKIGGVSYIKGRAVGSAPPTWLPILRSTSPLGKLMIRDAHNRWGHNRGVRGVAARLAESYHILGATTALKEARRKCSTCKYLLAKPLRTEIGPLPTSRTVPSRPFTHVQADIFGPYNVHDQVKRRVTCKVWALLVLCQFSRAVHTYVLADYSADAVCQAITRHISHHGAFLSFWSDRGTQLAAAGRIIMVDEENTPLDCSAMLLRQFPEVNWQHGPPSSPWCQGGAEVLIREVKKAMKIEQLLRGARYFSVVEFDTFLSKICTFINERPLVLGPEPGEALTPASLSLGTGLRFPSSQKPSSLLKRKQAVDEAFAEFWSRFITSPNLKKTFKFSEKSDDVNVGDVVLILDRPNALGWFKLGRIKEILNDRRVLVSVSGGKVIERHKRTLSRLSGGELNDV